MNFIKLKLLLFKTVNKQKQARKGFLPLSAMFVIIVFWKFLGIYLEDCFLEDLFGVLMEFFLWNFFGEILWEDFWGKIFLGGIFGRNSSKKLFEYGRKWYVCQDFGFCQDFGLRKGRKVEGKFKSLEVRLQAHHT